MLRSAVVSLIGKLVLCTYKTNAIAVAKMVGKNEGSNPTPSLVFNKLKVETSRSRFNYYFSSNNIIPLLFPLIIENHSG